MMPTKIVLCLVVIGSTGCLLKGGASAGLSTSTSSSPVKQTKKECSRKELGPLDDARLGCIVDSLGNTKRVGEVFDFTCKPFDMGKYENIADVAGSDPFPLSSRVCMAAVYAGKVEPGTGGPVKIQIVEKQDYTAGDEKHGVRSKKYVGSKDGAYGYTFVD